MLKRCFVAIDLPRRVINEIKRIQKQIWRKNLFIGRVTDSENLHLTLKFLGEIDNSKIEEVKQALRKIKFNNFKSKLGGKQVQVQLGGKQVQVQLGEIGFFSKKLPKILWIKLGGKIFDLQKEVDDALRGLFDSEDRFMSHITIARIKHVFNREKFVRYLESIRPEKIDFRVEKFFLKKSELSRCLIVPY